ncbi:MAG: diguanylate cyclase [Alphaproteobacteria bacterium]|nr:diguanylate cyclase [Alphaproteobacteria bacterium]
MDVTEVTRNFLMGFVLPLWLAAGIADWICHRATDIEHTTGTKESLMHLAMLVEAAIPVLAGMFLEVTSPVLALMLAAFLLHEATALWDVSYAVTRREVTPIEQHVHSFLEMVPLMAVSFLSVLHWPQLRALFGFGGRPDWSIRRKRRKLPVGYVATMLSLMAALEWGPYLEELWRDVRASSKAQAGR